MVSWGKNTYSVCRDFFIISVLLVKNKIKTLHICHAESNACSVLHLQGNHIKVDTRDYLRVLVPRLSVWEDWFRRLFGGGFVELGHGW